MTFPEGKATGRPELRTETWAGTDGPWCPRRGACGVRRKEAEEEAGMR